MGRAGWRAPRLVPDNEKQVRNGRELRLTVDRQRGQSLGHGELPADDPAGAGAWLLDDPEELLVDPPEVVLGALPGLLFLLAGWLDEVDELEPLDTFGWLGGLLTLIVGPLEVFGVVVDVSVGW